MIAEIKKRLLRTTFVFLVVFFCLVPFANQVYHSVALPLIAALPAGGKMIATSITTPLFIPIKLVFELSLLIMAPYAIYQVWAFFAPAFYAHEKRKVYPLLLLSMSLFYSGVAFVYYVVFPVIFPYFAHAAPEGVEIATDIAAFLEFTSTIVFTFAISFLLPVFICGACQLGITDRKTLAQKRSYVVVTAFVLGLFFTPPDVISQFLLAIPICLLFELGLILSWLFKPKVIHITPETDKN